ncbi:MAG: toxic anion resistance protein, partial [Pseudorhodobacter sp.]|nr:toxic anion resistance protein [Pseudorhodobacter sp.]
MTDTVRDQAATALAEVEKVTMAIMPVPSTAIVPLEAAPAPQAAEITRR